MLTLLLSESLNLRDFLYLNQLTCPSLGDTTLDNIYNALVRGFLLIFLDLGFLRVLGLLPKFLISLIFQLNFELHNFYDVDNLLAKDLLSVQVPVLVSSCGEAATASCETPTNAAKELVAASATISHALYAVKLFIFFILLLFGSLLTSSHIFILLLCSITIFLRRIAVRFEFLQPRNEGSQQLVDFFLLSIRHGTLRHAQVFELKGHT